MPRHYYSSSRLNTVGESAEAREIYEFEWMAPLCLHSPPLEKRNANRAVIYICCTGGSRTKPDAAQAKIKKKSEPVNFADILASKKVRVLVVRGVPSMTGNVGISMSINTQLARSILHSHTNNNATSRPSNYCPDLLGRPSCGLRPISQTGCFDCRQQTNLFGCLDA